MNASHKRKRPAGLQNEPLTQEQRQEKSLTKYHHAKVEATRALRKAITFETQKMAKRIKKARDEKEAEADLHRFEEELGDIKMIDVEELALYYLQYTIARSHKELATSLQVEQAGDAPHKQAKDSMKNVVGRLLGSKTFRSAIEIIIQSLEYIAGIKSLSRTTKPKKRAEAVHPKELVKRRAQADKSLEEVSVASSDSDDQEETEAGRTSRTSSALAKARDNHSTASTFLPSLQSGYLPALDSSDDEGQLKGLFPAQKKERKNRRGQRARRKILEAKHGNKANHIVKEREQAQKDYEERVARRAARELEKTGANAIAIEEAERNRKERREAKLRPIHGSWAVAKAAKEKMKQAKPEGQKITFD